MSQTNPLAPWNLQVIVKHRIQHQRYDILICKIVKVGLSCLYKFIQHVSVQDTWQYSYLKGVFRGSAHVQAYQLYPFLKKPTHMYFSILHTIISPSKTTNNQNSQKMSTNYTENVDIEYQNKLPE